MAAGWEIIIYDQGGTASEARDVDCALPNSAGRRSKLSRARQSVQTRRQIPLGNNVGFWIHNLLLDPTSGGSNWEKIDRMSVRGEPKGIWQSSRIEWNYFHEEVTKNWSWGVGWKRRDLLLEIAGHRVRGNVARRPIRCNGSSNEEQTMLVKEA